MPLVFAIIRIKEDRRKDVTYISVVDDYYESGERHVRQVAAFGPRTMESVAKATMFIAAAESAMGLAGAAKSKGEKEALLAVFGEHLGLDLTQRIILARGKQPHIN